MSTTRVIHAMPVLHDARARRATRTGLVIGVACVVGAPQISGAQVDRPVPDKAAYSLLDPTPRDRMRDMSTDRPDMTESPYTVDAGHAQVELSFIDFTYDHRNDDSQTVRAMSVAPMLLKVGLTNSVDLQLGLDPYTHERVTDRLSDSRETTDGFGDTIFRLKCNLWGNDNGNTALAVMPFIKCPTANELGNGNIEGGLIVPLAIAISEELGLGLMAEVDFNRSAEDDRYVTDFVHTATLGRKLVGELAGFVEYAGLANLNGDEGYRAYLNSGLTYAVSSDIQLDAGVRVGLSEAADDLGVFAGISLRF